MTPKRDENGNGNGRLTNKRKVFIAQYLRCWNATEAARRAGYKNPNKLGPRLVKVGEIASEIDSRIEELTMSADEVLVRLAEQGRGEIGSYILDDGTVDFARIIADDKAHLLKKIHKTSRFTKDKEEIVRLSVEVYDAQRALELIGKHHKLFVEQTDLNIRGEMDVNVTDARDELDRRLSDIIARTDQAGISGDAGQ